MSLFRNPLVVAGLIAAAPLASEAQQWNGGGGNSNVSTALNWTPNGAPVSGAATALTFPTATPSLVNFDSAFTLNSMTFSGSSPYTFSGSTVTLGAGGISNGATATVGFNNSLQLANSSMLATTTTGSLFVTAVDLGANGLTTNAATGSITIRGNLTGTGGLTAGTGLTFIGGAANTYSGGTTINSGATLQVGDPTGTFSVSLPGNVTDNGTLNIKPLTANYTYTGVVSG